jgi:hypothetical protein
VLGPLPSLSCACLHMTSMVELCMLGITGVQVWQNGGKDTGNESGGVCAPPTSSHLCSFSSYRHTGPHWFHVHEPVSSLVHREANGWPPQLHGHPSECPKDPECSGDAPQCPGLSIQSHHFCHGPTLRSAGSPTGNQFGCPTQLSGKCPSCAGLVSYLQWFSPRQQT